MGNKNVFEVSLKIMPKDITLKVKSNIKIKALRFIIASNVEIPPHLLVI
jgi:hypothetical protein